MNPISNALIDLRLEIDISVLNLVFNKPEYGGKYTSLDSKIEAAVIRPHVMKDCNLIGGETITVPLIYCNVEKPNINDLLITVPDSLLNGRAIITANSLLDSFNSGNSGSYKQSGAYPAQSDMGEQFTRMHNSVSFGPGMATAHLTVIGRNIVYVTDINTVMSYGNMIVTVENGRNYENLPRRSYPIFTELVILAVKAFIFSHVRLNLDKGYIYQGHDLGYVNEVVESYSSASADYREYLRTKWKTVSIASDRDFSMLLLKASLGCNI